MADEKFELSRRKALLGLGSVGVASVGAGMGTSAYFSDQEEFTDNTIQAGEFGLEVEQKIHDVDQDGIGPDEMKFDRKANGVYATDTIEIEDAKPGDEYMFCWDFEVHDNPGYVAVVADAEDKTGAEAENVDADDLWDIDDNSDLSTLGEEVMVDSVEITNNGADYKYGSDYGTLEELLEDLEDGLLFVDNDDDAFKFHADETWTFCVELSIPSDVGNELQGAHLEWNKTFYAEQARHNDDMDAFVGRAVDAHGE